MDVASIRKPLATRLREMADVIESGELTDHLEDAFCHACTDAIIYGVGYVRISEVEGKTLVERLEPEDVAVRGQPKAPPAPDTYQDDRFCGHCEKDTLHRCFDSGHERDGSNDWQECLTCGWCRFGNGSYVPPFKADPKRPSEAAT